MLQFSATRCKRSVDQLVIEDLNAPVVLDFLSHLETSRANTVRTRNARLAAVQTFFRYIRQQPSLAALCSPVLAIPAKRPSVLYWAIELSRNLVTCWRRLIARPGTENVITCSSACSMTPALVFKNFDLKPRDFHLDTPPFVRLRGKGRRERLCPLLPQSAQLVRNFLAALGRRLDDQEPYLKQARSHPEPTWRSLHSP